MVVPTFERRQLVQRAVESVLEQTFTDFELIVVDDGSRDGTAETLLGLDTRLHYCWQENRGVASARNAGIRLARGETVAFLDSDDRWLPEHLAVLTEMLADHPEAILACTHPRSLRAGPDSRLVDLLPELLVVNSTGPPSCVAVRRASLVDARGFDQSLSWAEDLDLWLRLALRGPFALRQHPTIKEDVRPDSLQEQGRLDGSYPRVHEYILERAIVEVARLERDDAPELRQRAEGSLRLWHAVAAAVRDDEPATRAALGDALRLLPELTDDLRALVGHIRLTATGPAHERRLLEALAAQVPDQESRGARALRERAASLEAEPAARR